jgi:hypothetical protein
MKRSMVKAYSTTLLIFVLMVATGGCASYVNYLHDTYDYGRITAIRDQEIVIFIGCRERVKKGQIVDVYKKVKASPGFTRRYKEITMGIAEITEIPDGCHAVAKILYGNIDKDCRVAL